MTINREDLERRFMPVPSTERQNPNSPFHGQHGSAFKSRREAAKSVIQGHLFDLEQFALHYIVTNRWNDFKKWLSEGKQKCGHPLFEHYEDGWQIRWKAPMVHKGIQRYLMVCKLSQLRSSKARVFRLSTEAPEDLREAESASLAQRKNNTSIPSEREWSETLERETNTRILGEESSTSSFRLLVGLDQEFSVGQEGVAQSKTTIRTETENTWERGHRTEDEKGTRKTWSKEFSGNIEIPPHKGVEVRINWFNQTIIDRLIVQEELDFGKIEFIVDRGHLSGEYSKLSDRNTNITKEYAIWRGEKRGPTITYNGFQHLRDHVSGETGPRANEVQKRANDFRYLVRNFNSNHARQIVAPRLAIHEEGVLFEEETREIDL